MPANATRAMSIRGIHSRSLGSRIPRGGEARVAYLRGALLDNRLRLLAQPIVDVHTGEVAAEELLLRIVRRNGQVEAPGPYIQAAEQSRLAIEIDGWVLDRAARLAAREGRRLHVNLSGRTVAEGSFGDRIEETLERHGAKPAQLTFEITETAPVLDGTNPGVVARRIAALGSGLALDDFGKGYGTLTYLHRMPVTMLKIDREFVAQAASSARARAIVEAVVCIANRVGQITVAEGVEDAATLSVVRSCGVDLAQGFYSGRPAPV
jgi:EAL domain-containing protein (putative c-di-GMP-specific phosphodiesterase class I)